MKTITEMALEAYALPYLASSGPRHLECLTRFAELAKADRDADLLEGVEMPETVAWMHTQANYSIISTHQKETNEFQFTDDFLARHDKGLHTAEQLRETVAAAVLRKDAEIAAITNVIGNAQLAAFIEKHGEPVPIVAERDALKVENERLRADAEILEWIFDNATSAGGGHGFTMSVHVPVDHEDEKCGIIAAMKGQP